MIEITMMLYHETELAILVSEGSGEKIWLPKSQVEIVARYEMDKPTEIDLEIPMWLADQHNLSEGEM